MENATDVAYIARHAGERPDAPAVIAGGAVTSYRELWLKIQGFAQFLKTQMGLKRGDVVVAKASQSLEYAVAYFGTHLAGGIFAPVEQSASGNGLLRILENLTPHLLIVNSKDAETDFGPWGKRMLVNSEICRIADQYVPQEEWSDFPNGSDIAVILFTTGTTGVSKGVVHTQCSTLAIAENLITGCEMKKDSLMVILGPLNHAAPSRKMVMSMVNGSAAVILNGLKNLRAFFDVLETAAVPVGCSASPAALRTILTLTGDKIGAFADKIDFMVFDGSPLPESDKQKISELLPNSRLYNCYGSTESGSVCMYDFNRYPGKINCIGKAGRNSELVTVDDGKNVIESSSDHPGILAISGKTNMQGYWKAPELTAQVMQEGRIHTNDIGYIDSEGFIYNFGRQGDVINVGGLKVAPTEVEAVALWYDAVADCICVPVDDPISGKAVKLCVVLKPGMALDGRGLRSHMMEHLENYKVPKYIEEISEVPRTFNGKIDRKKLLAPE